MLLDKANVQEKLLQDRQKVIDVDTLLHQVEQILSQNTHERNKIAFAIREKSSTNQNEFVIDLLETDKIFHIDQIKAICIAYRLRFLDSHYFKDDLPAEAISEIRRLENLHQTTLQGFKIMATSKTFQLLSYDDPLLFAPLGNGYYYLIHKWGEDLHPARKLLVTPFKNILNFVIFTALLSLLFSAFVPESNLSKTVAMAPIIIYLFMFKSVFAVGMYAFFMKGKNFNEAIWNRVYFNN